MKPCPFCGKNKFYFAKCDQGVRVFCPDCNIDTLMLTDSFTEAVGKWNRRVKE